MSPLATKSVEIVSMIRYRWRERQPCFVLDVPYLVAAPIHVPFLWLVGYSILQARRNGLFEEKLAEKNRPKHVASSVLPCLATALERRTTFFKYIPVTYYIPPK